MNKTRTIVTIGGGIAGLAAGNYLTFSGLLDHAFERLGLKRPLLVPLRKITANQTTILPDGSAVTIGDGLDMDCHQLPAPECNFLTRRRFPDFTWLGRQRPPDLV